MSLKQDKISAFNDGNSFVEYNHELGLLLVGNSVGILKVFDPKNADLEPYPIDILENLTSLNSYNNYLLVTNTVGHVELFDLKEKDNKGVLYRSELPLRDAVFINEGKRIVCGGDDNKLIVINFEDTKDSDSKSVDTVSLPEQLVNLTYNISSEILAVSLSNGDVQLFSVINEQLSLMETLKNVLPVKIHSSLDEIDFQGDHSNELVATSCQWSKNSDFLFAPTSVNSIKKYNRDWQIISEYFVNQKIIDFKSNNQYLFVLTKTNLQVVDVASMKLIKEFELSSSDLLINLIWSEADLYVGTNNGVIFQLKDLIKDLDSENSSGETTPEIDENNADALFSDNATKRGVDDSILDASDDEDDDDGRFPYYNKPVDQILEQRKRQKTNNGRSVTPNISESIAIDEKIIPYSPGSTPFNKSAQVQRRYLTMNSTGYVWVVKTEEETQSITVSFFDRSVNKDYHFSDLNKFDLCGINQHGIVLATSNYKQDKGFGSIYYRNHESDQDSWDRKIPLVKNEYITCVSITNNEESNILVGTNFGYLRYYNKYGLCLNVIKMNPIISIICNEKVVFVINKLSTNLYSYSMIIEEDYKFLQQDCLLPLKASEDKLKPLIKGIFFNEYNDPCLVPGNDETLIILSNWRESTNSKWIPILNCNEAITENGSDLKKHWKVWPLGLFGDKLNCLLIKNQDNYPGFPLPMPIELQIKLPINCVQEVEEGAEEEEDMEECFIKSVTMGKLINDSLMDSSLQEFNDEMADKLTYYTNLFDKSLLKLFASSCKSGNLSKSFSIAKMMKNDKALIAAGKICQRFEFNNLATKIGKLRDSLMEIEDI